MKKNIRKLIVGSCVALLCLADAAAVPEMWVVPLDEKVPNVTPSGKVFRSVSFVVRFCCGGDKAESVIMYESVFVGILDVAGKPIEPTYERNTSFLPTHEDVFLLLPGIVYDKSYEMFFEEGRVLVPDGTGGVYSYEVPAVKVLEVSVLYDTTRRESDKSAREFEEQYGDKIFKGSVECGRFKIKVSMPLEKK
jgi:hypothetical protein